MPCALRTDSCPSELLARNGKSRLTVSSGSRLCMDGLPAPGGGPSSRCGALKCGDGAACLATSVFLQLLGGLVTQDNVPCQHPQTRNLFIKNCVFILICLNFSHLQSTLHLVNTPIKTFFHCSKQFFNSFTLMPFSASAVLCYTSSTLSGFVFL